MYKTIEHAIEFAMQEVRYAMNEVSCISGNEEIDIEAYAKLRRVYNKLQEAEEEMPN